MSFISFNWTTAPLLCGAKTVTRRKWVPRYARMFREGQEVTAYDHSPRNGGQPVAIIKLLNTPFLQSVEAMTTDDWIAEGFQFLHSHPELRPKRIFGHACEEDEFALHGGFERWKQTRQTLYVVRFELLVRMRDVDCGPTG